MLKTDVNNYRTITDKDAKLVGFTFLAKIKNSRPLKVTNFWQMTKIYFLENGKRINLLSHLSKIMIGNIITQKRKNSSYSQERLDNP